MGKWRGPLVIFVIVTGLFGLLGWVCAQGDKNLKAAQQQAAQMGLYFNYSVTWYEAGQRVDAWTVCTKPETTLDGNVQFHYRSGGGPASPICIATIPKTAYTQIVTETLWQVP